jgi:hypothetical protein
MARTVLPKLVSTTTRFLEQQAVATHIALLGKNKVVVKRKNSFIYY